MARFDLACSECGSSFAERPNLLVCPDCSTMQQPGGEVRGVLRVRLENPPSSWPTKALNDPTWLSSVLPIVSPQHLSALSVGATPLFDVPRLREDLGISALWLKDDTRNPSGSTKDRASQLVVAKAKEYGFDTVATASTGNAATALAAVAASEGLVAVVLVPASAPPAKLVQMASYGARVIPVDGSYDQAYELCGEACNAFGWYNRSTALNPYTIEGKKTAALEIAAQLAPEAPDVIVVPAGDGVITAGLAKGFADLKAGNLLDRTPRLVIVQPAGSSAIATALRSGSPTVIPCRGAQSIADSLVVERPRNGRLCLAEVRASGGGGVIVDDEAIQSAIHRLASLTGVFAEPAAAAVLPGLEMALSEGLVTRTERIVLLVTGTGLKDVDAARRSIELPTPVSPNITVIHDMLNL
jgi:threonine synthase